MSGVFEKEGADGRSVHERTVVRRESYFVCWSGVRGLGGVGWDVEDGWMKGVLMGLEEPSTVVVVGLGMETSL